MSQKLKINSTPFSEDKFWKGEYNGCKFTVAYLADYESGATETKITWDIIPINHREIEKEIISTLKLKECQN